MEFHTIIIFLTLVLCVSTAGIKKRCNLQFKCSLDEKTAWATDGKRCFVFRNGCYLSRENCNRLNRCKPELCESEEKLCQKLCPRPCNKIYKPVCCYYSSNNKQQFTNQCEMDNHICKTGKTCEFTDGRPCESVL